MPGVSIAENPQVLELIDLAYKEDAGHGDVTSHCLIDPKRESKAHIIARENFIFCGGVILEKIIQRFGFSISVKDIVSDGSPVANNSSLAVLHGFTHEILTLERTALNFFQRLSGVATNTARFVSKAHGVKILDTRKTMPGWRVLEKYAVRIGGGQNHRMHLGDMVLVKNNHVDAYQGDWQKLSEALSANKPAGVPVEIEVRDQSELHNTLQYFNPEFILLDNMSDTEISTCVELIRSKNSKIKIEVSGGVTEDRLKFLSTLGEIYVSVGALTTKATNVDISLRIISS